MNLQSKHRFERKEDQPSDLNYDWMASLAVEERISTAHMDHQPGVSVKDPDDLAIQDFIPSAYEKSYLLDSLVSYYSYRLVERHPIVFKCIKPHVKQNKPHQFESEMSRKSNEYTAGLFTKK